MDDGLIRVSLRSKGNIDVARIAKSLGGGGHRAAAGIKSRLPLAQLRGEIIECVRHGLDNGHVTNNG